MTVVCELTLTRGDRRARATVGKNETTIIAERAGREDELIRVQTQCLPEALARLNDLGPRPRVESTGTHRVPAPELARVIAARRGSGLPALDELLLTLREHWRVDASWDSWSGKMSRTVEVLDTEQGLWLVDRGDVDVELSPTTPTQVWRLITGLLPRIGELPGAATAAP